MLLKTQEKKGTGDRRHFRSMQQLRMREPKKLLEKEGPLDKYSVTLPPTGDRKARQEATRTLTAPLQPSFRLT